MWRPISYLSTNLNELFGFCAWHPSRNNLLFEGREKSLPNFTMIWKIEKDLFPCLVPTIMIFRLPFPLRNQMGQFSSKDHRTSWKTSTQASWHTTTFLKPYKRWVQVGMPPWQLQWKSILSETSCQNGLRILSTYDLSTRTAHRKIIQEARKQF